MDLGLVSWKSADEVAKDCCIVAMLDKRMVRLKLCKMHDWRGIYHRSVQYVQRRFLVGEKERGQLLPISRVSKGKVGQAH